MRTKQRIVHRCAPSNLNLGIFVYSFDVCRALLTMVWLNIVLCKRCANKENKLTLLPHLYITPMITVNITAMCIQPCLKPIKYSKTPPRKSVKISVKKYFECFPLHLGDLETGKFALYKYAGDFLAKLKASSQGAIEKRVEASSVASNRVRQQPS